MPWNERCSSLPQGPAVTTAGECRRAMMVGEKEHVMKQTCAPHAFGLRVITTLYDTRRPSKIVDKKEYHSLGAKDGLGGVAQPAGGAITTAAIPSYPAPLVGKLTAGVVEETVVMDIGVDPVVGMAPVVGAEMKKAKETAFRKRENACLMQKVTCTHFGDSFLLRQYVNQGRAVEVWCS